MKSVYIKLGVSLVAIIIALTAYVGWLDNMGEQYTQQGLKRALITYGVARGLNGVISVAQGTEVAFEPVGVGMTFTPGQILDPVNDLIERFSWVVLASGASLGVQNILIQVTSWLWFTSIILVFLCLSIYVLWRQSSQSIVTRNFIYKTSLVLIIVRFSIPAIAVVNEVLYETFLEPQYVEAKLSLQQTSNDIDMIKNPQPVVSEDASIVEKVKYVYHSASDVLDVKSQLELLKKTVANVSESALNMMVVFIMQTLIFPLLFLWLTLKLIKFVMKVDLPKP